jgi:hypothetical protein
MTTCSQFREGIQVKAPEMYPTTGLETSVEVHGGCASGQNSERDEILWQKHRLPLRKASQWMY